MRIEDLPDYYALLQVHPLVDGRELEQAYHRLAKRYHPDTIASADPDRFQQVVEAYGFLRDPQRRALYNNQRGLADGPGARSDAAGFGAGFGDLSIEADAAIEDAEMIERILLSLYKQRREHPGDAGLVGWLLQEKLGCAEDRFEFHAWYLKEKGYAQTDQEGKLVITVAGVDHIVATSKHNQAQKRITSMMNENGPATAE
ncbi:J domain-containing protein [Aurantiacibacter luteus]|uniref:J domain-containing protein n=1 Tax=Aurantiacibacter luteus TaxID=1581420 RepID=A0A0G9MKN5_9SPHN|nr:DnaJ domain-containing protein [Aurantiacibacter luteus]KLE31242.1 hypothetical protein AAW00_13830 [Aurantiacibacter luteus]